MSKLEELLTKEMTRRQFLVTVGLSLVSLFGFSTIMGILTGDSKTTQNHSSGYGARPYGS
jgi:hypothetical protein